MIQVRLMHVPHGDASPASFGERVSKGSERFVTLSALMPEISSLRHMCVCVLTQKAKRADDRTSQASITQVTTPSLISLSTIV